LWRTPGRSSAEGREEVANREEAAQGKMTRRRSIDTVRKEKT
jgi:hypothetical protein